ALAERGGGEADRLPDVRPVRVDARGRRADRRPGVDRALDGGVPAEDEQRPAVVTAIGARRRLVDVAERGLARGGRDRERAVEDEDDIEVLALAGELELREGEDQREDDRRPDGDGDGAAQPRDPGERAARDERDEGHEQEAEQEPGLE